MRKRSCMVPLILFLCISCAERQTHLTEAPLSTKAPDIIVEDGGLVTRFFDSPNAYALARIAETRSNPIVSAALTHFEAGGYEFRDDYSFVTEGSSDGRSVDICVLAMVNGRDEGGDAIHLFCIGRDDKTVVLPFCVSRDASLSLDAYDEPVGRVNFAVLDPFVAGAGTQVPDQADWKWKRWGQCVGTTVAGGGTGCLLHCRFVPLAYLKCLGVCSAGHILSSVVMCSIREFSENKGS